MGGGSATRQHERRFSQRESSWSDEKEEACSFDDMPEMVKAFGLYEVYRSRDGGYELAKGGVVVAAFSEARIEKDRVLFPLSRGTLLEVSEKGRREILSPAKAMLCGLIAADGGNHFYWRLDKTRGRYTSQYKTYFFSEDEELIEIFDGLFKKIYNKTPHHYLEGEGIIRAMVNDKGIFYDLNDIGVKTGPFKFHVPIEHLDEKGLRAYLRGFFSGDGNVSKTGNKYMIRQYSKHRECLEELRHAYIVLDFRPGEIQERERERVRRGRIERWTDRWFTISSSKEDNLRFVKEIGSHKPKHLRAFEKLIRSHQQGHEKV